MWMMENLIRISHTILILALCYVGGDIPEYSNRQHF